MDYEVKSGDWLSKIALKHGFNDGGAAIWDANPDLREKSGGNPDILQPGWIIQIPELKPWRFAGKTGSEFCVRKKYFAKKLIIILRDQDNKEISGWNYRVRAGQKELAEGVTDSTGRIGIQNLPEDIDQVELELWEEGLFKSWGKKPEIIKLNFDLKPLQGEEQSFVEAVQQRLTSLNYNPGKIDGKFGPRTRAAIRNFQSDRGIRPAHGLCDEVTCRALIVAAGSHKGKLLAKAEGDKEHDDEDPLNIGEEASLSIEDVTGFSEFVEPTAHSPIGDLKPETQELDSSPQFFFPEVSVALSSSDDKPNENILRMGSRKFIFLDVGKWLGDAENAKNRRSFGLIYGRFAYLCHYLLKNQPENQQVNEKPAESNALNSLPKNSERLDVKFFVNMGPHIVIDKWASAAWAPHDDFDWKKLYLIIPDTHFMTKETAAIWFGLPDGNYQFKAEHALLEFAKRIVNMGKLCDNIEIIQIGDAYDLWVNCTPCQFIKNDGLTIELEEGAADRVLSWISEIRDSGPLAGSLNPGMMAYEELEGKFAGRMIYIYGNHDNYLIRAKNWFIKNISVHKRVPYHAPPGIFMEHGHRMESRFFGFEDVGIEEIPFTGKRIPHIPHNYDGEDSGFKATNNEYINRQQGKKSLIDLKNAADIWAQIRDQPSYWGEQAQVWLGRQSRGDKNKKPPHIFVIAHTHCPELRYIKINPTVLERAKIYRRRIEKIPERISGLIDGLRK